jgi:hypothetical protein
MSQLAATTQQKLLGLRDRARDFIGQGGLRPLVLTGLAAECVAHGIMFMTLGVPAGAPLFIVGLFGLTRARQWLGDMRGSDKISWMNDAGQKVRTTLREKWDLQGAQDEIYDTLSRARAAARPDAGQTALARIQSIADAFARTAARATIIEDSIPPAGKFAFVRTMPGTT